MWKRGQWYAVCDVCGFKFLSGVMRERWDGLTVDPACWETRHPQELIRPVKEQTPAWTNPEPDDLAISPHDYTEYNYDTDYAQFPNDPRYTTLNGY